MSKMAELDMEIREALDAHTGPKSYLSCVDIAKMIGVPVEMVHQIVQERWDETLKANGVTA
jgi:hypothetical protein